MRLLNYSQWPRPFSEHCKSCSRPQIPAFAFDTFTWAGRHRSSVDTVIVASLIRMNAAAAQQQKKFSLTATSRPDMWQAVTTGTVINVVDQFQPLRLMPWDLCFSFKRPKYRYSQSRLIQKQPVRVSNDENERLMVKLPFMVASARSYYECGLQLTRTVKCDLGALPSCHGMIRDKEYVKLNTA